MKADPAATSSLALQSSSISPHPSSFNLHTLFEKFDLFADAPDAVAKMRELVRDLAVRGRLFGKAVENEADGLPNGWHQLQLGEVAQFINGDRSKNYPSKSFRVDDGVPFINAGHLSNGDVDLADMDYITPEHFDRLGGGKIERGDVLYCLRGSLGKCAVVQGIDRGAIASSLLIIRPSRQIASRFIYLFLTSPLGARMIAKYDNGSAQPNLSAANVKKYILPLPPLAEQKRIVAKVDELMASCDRLEAQQQERETRHAALVRASLARFADAPTPANLDFLFHSSFNIQPSDLRKSILTLAVQGKLVPQDPNDEPAEELVARITARRYSNKAKPYMPIAADDAPYEVPFSWVWVRLGSISLTSDSGWSPQCLPEARSGTDWGILKVSAVSWGVFKPDENKALPTGITPRPACEVKAGDFLLSRANTEDLVARSVVVDQAPPRLMMSDKIVRFTFPDEISREFINLANTSDPSRAYYARSATGTSSSMKNIGREVMCNLPIPLPPLAEQRRIVAKVDQLMALVDELEAQITTSRATAARLLEAVVAALTTPAKETEGR